MGTAGKALFLQPLRVYFLVAGCSCMLNCAEVEEMVAPRELSRDLATSKCTRTKSPIRYCIAGNQSDFYLSEFFSGMKKPKSLIELA